MKYKIHLNIILLLFIISSFSCKEKVVPKTETPPTPEELIIGAWELQYEWAYGYSVEYSPNEVIFTFEEDSCQLVTNTSKEFSYPDGTYQYKIDFDCFFSEAPCLDSEKNYILYIFDSYKKTLLVDSLKLVFGMEYADGPEYVFKRIN